MADIAAGARQPAVNDWDIPAVGAQFAHWITNTVVAVFAAITAPGRRHSRAQRHYRRESFVEDAAMSREMFRL